MKTIWKFPLLDIDRTNPDVTPQFDMPVGAVIRHVGRQGPDLYLWAEVDPQAEKVTRRFVIVGTGVGHTPEPGAYLGTVQLEELYLVLHVYEVP